MSEHCKRVSASTRIVAERLFDIDLMFSMDHPGDDGLFADAIALSQALQDKLEIIVAYYEHKCHLP